MKPRCIACWVTEKAPEITAWLAMIVAKVGDIRAFCDYQRSGSAAFQSAAQPFGAPASSSPGSSQSNSSA